MKKPMNHYQKTYCKKCGHRLKLVVREGYQSWKECPSCHAIYLLDKELQ